MINKEIIYNKTVRVLLTMATSCSAVSQTTSSKTPFLRRVSVAIVRGEEKNFCIQKAYFQLVKPKVKKRVKKGC
jgi:hypothetical protein